MRKPTVSICVIAMNRLHHVKETLPASLKENDDQGINFVLLDYNSCDGLGGFIQTNFSEEIKKGRLIYYRYNDAQVFDRSHSRNMALKLADGKIVCNVDADNYAGAGFGNFVQDYFSKNQGVCLTGLENEWKHDASGKLCVSKPDFLAVTGYDERFEGYGYEDYDLVNRLQLNGCAPFTINISNYLQAIAHERDDRLHNEGAFKHFHSLHVHFIDPATSKLVYLFKDRRLVSGVVENNYIKNCDDPKFIIRKKDRISFQFDIPNDWQKGNWVMRGSELHLSANGSNEVCYRDAIQDQQIFKNTRHTYYQVTDQSMILEAIAFLTETKNRQKLMENVSNKNIKVNHQFGQGVVYKNFNTNHPIEI